MSEKIATREAYGKALVELGYKDVEDFGGINRWKGELVK